MMSRDIERAKRILASDGVTFCAVKGDTVITDTKRGIAPLMEIYEREGSLDGFSAADKVVGKAAAFLYVRLGVKELYAEVISSHALTVLRKQGINAAFFNEVPAIINREGTGYCPMESAVLDISDAHAALVAIKLKLASMTRD